MFEESLLQVWAWPNLASGYRNQADLNRLSDRVNPHHKLQIRDNYCFLSLNIFPKMFSKNYNS